MIDLVSVIIPTFNPNLDRLNQTLDGLKKQTLDHVYWELIVVDNNSKVDFSKLIDLSWHNNARVIAENKQGLTYARLKGFMVATGNIIILVDDDNILDRNYLRNAVAIFEEFPRMGAAGGKSIPIFLQEQPPWLPVFYNNLALRNPGDQIIVEEWQNRYPDYAPFGAGMVVKRAALTSYISKVTSLKNPVADRTGSSLSSGGDNDIVLELLKAGWQTGYFPDLVLQHIIPGERLTISYMAKLLKSTNKSWVQLLESHGINPWRKIPVWTVPLRKIKAWISYKAWKNRESYIKWKGACGTFEGLSEC